MADQQITPEYLAELRAAAKLANAFHQWKALDSQLEKLGPKAVSPEAIAAAWRKVTEAHEEWDNSR